MAKWNGGYDQSIYPPNIWKCKLRLVTGCYSWWFCYYFVIDLIDTQRFWALSCHLQYAGGGRNSSHSLILQLHTLSFVFCISFPYWSSCSPFKGLLCTFSQPVVHHWLHHWHYQCIQPCPLPPLNLLPLYAVCRRQPSGLCPSHSINPILFISSRQLSGPFIIQSPPWLNVLSKLIIRQQTKCVHSQQHVRLLSLAEPKHVKISMDPSLFDQGLMLHFLSFL